MSYFAILFDLFSLATNPQNVSLSTAIASTVTSPLQRNILFIACDSVENVNKAKLVALSITWKALKLLLRVIIVVSGFELS